MSRPSISLSGSRTRSTSAALVLVALAAAAAVALQGPSGATLNERPRQASVRITGNIRAPLRPGTSQPLNLRLRNTTPSPLLITRLRITVSVDAAHRAAGCSARRDFSVRQLPRRAYPIKLGRRRRATLRALRVRSLPRIAMRNLPRTNQDACMGARLRLRYTAVMRRVRPR